MLFNIKKNIKYPKIMIIFLFYIMDNYRGRAETQIYVNIKSDKKNSRHKEMTGESQSRKG